MPALRKMDDVAYALLCAATDELLTDVALLQQLSQ
jgi:hypothetical protein